ncbi:hypothetical protein PUN28_014093 [Cardiocondyla obscurior]|uniref:Ribosomal protein S3 n=1 Tax=Cardiocondyla obscurior TaxID=286306 RepID=A0AAW2F3B9_9HYME
MNASINAVSPLALNFIGKRYVTAANQRDHPEFRGSRRSLSDHSWCKRKFLDLPSTPDSTNTLQSEFRFRALGTKGSRRKLTKETVRRAGEAAEVSLTIPGARVNSSTYPVLQIALTLCRVNSGLALWGRKVSRFGDERFATETNQGNRLETRGSRRSLSDHSWCKRKFLDLPSTPDSSNTLQSEFRFRALGTKGSRWKLTKETVRRPGEAAEVSLTIPGARENSSTYPVLQIALTFCRVNSGFALRGRKVSRFGDERFATETNLGNRPETRGSRRSLSDHSWCKRKILDLPSTPDSTNTLQSEFRFGALGTKGSRRKLTKETVRRLGEAAEVSLTISGAREKSSTYPVLQIALTLCRVNSGLALWGRKALNFIGKRYVTAANQRNRPETRGSRRSLSDHSWCKRKFLDLPSTPDSTNTLQSEFRFGALGTKGSRRKLTKKTVRRPGKAAEVSLTIPGAREKSSTYPVLQIALTLCRVWRFGDERFATETNQGNRPKTRESRRSLSDHSWCKRKFLDLPSTPDSTNTLQNEFRFGALGTKGSRRKLTKETVRRPGKAAEVSLTIPGARENSSTYPVLQIALTLCRVNSGLALWGRKVWRFGDERFATETNQGNRPKTRESRRSLSDHSWCKRKFLDLPSTPDSTNTLQSEFRFGALGTKGSRRKLTKETVRRPGKAAEVSLTIPGAREKSSTYPVLQIALTLCRVNSGLALWGRKVWRFGDERFATKTNQGNRPETWGSRRSPFDHSWCKRKILDLPSTPDSINTLQSEFRFGVLGTKGSRRKLTKETVRRPREAAEVSLIIPGARENSSTYPVLQIALTLCRLSCDWSIWKASEFLL